MNYSKFLPAKALLILWLTVWMIMGMDLLVINALAQNSSRELVEKGVTAYQNAEFEDAINALQQALSRQIDQQKSDLVDAYKYLAFSHIVLGNTQKGKDAFINLLRIQPDYELPLTESPRFLGVFNAVKAEFSPSISQPAASVTDTPVNIQQSEPPTRQDQDLPSSNTKKSGKKTWLWIGLGAVAAGGAAALLLGGSGSDGGDTGTTTGFISITVPEEPN